MNSYDVAVIGAGPGGYETAIRCAQKGLKTALIEEADLGGTCLNRGCMPTKALLQGANRYYDVTHPAYGVKAENVSLDFEQLYAFKDEIVSRLRNGVRMLEKAYKVDLITGHAVLNGPDSIMVGDRLVLSKNIIISTGSRPAALPIPGADGERVITSNDVFHLQSRPESLILVGGGVVGIEFATLLAKLGTKVTVLEALPEIMPGLEPEIRQCLLANLSACGDVSVHAGAMVSAIASEAESARVTCTVNGEKKEFSATYCVLAVGRKANIEKIGLEKAGIETEGGFIKVDSQMRTNVKNVYAIGDVTGKVMLSHIARAQGMVCADVISGQAREMDYTVVPSCVYTSPEIATVGLSEKEAREKYPHVRTGLFYASGSGKCQIEGCATGATKLVVNDDTGELLGAQVCAPRATDTIAEICAVMMCEGTEEELRHMIHPHPTVSEMWYETANDLVHMSCSSMPKR